MTTTRKRSVKVLSFILMFAMILPMLPVTAIDIFAAESSSTSESTTELITDFSGMTNLNTAVNSKPTVTTSSVHPDGKNLTGDKLIDGKFYVDDWDDRWAPADGNNDKTPTATFEYPRAVSFDIVRISENSHIEGRVKSVEILVSDDGTTYRSVCVSEGGVNEEKIIYLPETVTTKYLRVVFTKSGGTGANSPCISEIEVYNSVEAEMAKYYGGENLAFKSTPTASDNHGGYGPERLINGSYASDDRWAPLDNKKNQWVKFTWSEEQTFDTVRLSVPQNAKGEFLNRSESVDFQISDDGETFTTVKTLSGEIGYDRIVKFGETVTTKYLRLYITSANNGSRATNLAEVEVYYANGDAEIKSFDIPNSETSINNEKGTIAVITESLSRVFTPVIEIAPGATVTPVGVQDFTDPVEYTVTSFDGNVTKKYTVTVRGFTKDADLEDKAVVVDPWGALPMNNQYKYLKEGLAAFLHFGMNTMTGSGWGSGEEKTSQWTLDENIDADGYVKTLKEAGFTRIVFTAKHHDGFCNWDSKYTTHDIAATVYPKDANGTNEESNPVYDFVKACVDNDMQFGFYYSPWDRNQAIYGCYGYKDAAGNKLDVTYEEYKALSDDEKFKQYWEDGENYFTDYNDYAFAQLTELCDIVKKLNAESLFVEMWYDGAKASWTDKTTLPQKYLSAQWRTVITDYFKDYYPEIMDQLIFQAGIFVYEMGTGGNESGKTNDGLWQQLNGVADADGNREYLWNAGSTYQNYNLASTGTRNNDFWYIYEPDGMITHEWFGGKLSTTLRTRPKSVEKMRDMYLRSIGYGTVLLLNVPLDEHGKLEDRVAERVVEMGQDIAASYENDDLITALGADISVSDVYENAKSLSPNNMIDGNDDTYWVADSADASIIIDFPSKVTFDVVEIEEAIQLGQRIDGYEIYYMNDAGEWNMFHNGITIAARRIAQSAPVTSNRIKIVLHGMKNGTERALPCISAISVHKASEAYEFRAVSSSQLSTLDSTSKYITGDFYKVTDEFDAKETGDKYDEYVEYVLGRSYLEGDADKSFTVSFSGNYAELIGQMMKDTEIKVKVDGITYTIKNGGAATVMGDAFFKTGNLSDENHTITVTVVKGTLRLDCVNYMSGKTTVEFEKDVFTVLENSENKYQIKLVRRGDLSSETEVSVIIGENLETVTFDLGESQKLFTLDAGDLGNSGSFTVSFVPFQPNVEFGSITEARVDIIPSEKAESLRKGIEVTKAPEKTTYRVGEAIDLRGIEVSGFYLGNPKTRTLYETSGIAVIKEETENTTDLGEKSGDAFGRRDVLGESVYADSVKFTFYRIAAVNAFQKSNISEVEIYNSKDTSNTNIARTAKPDAISGDSSYKLLNNGGYSYGWGADWATECDVWAELSWDEIVEFDTIDIYEYLPTSNRNNNYQWTDFTVSANVYSLESVALDENYTVSPQTIERAGRQNITITDKYGNQATFEITVNGPALDQHELTIKTNETKQLIFINPQNGMSAHDCFTSSDDNVATIDGNGWITPHGVGTTTITAQIDGYVDYCKVTVVSELIDLYESPLTFDGFSIRFKDYNGLRSVFSFDETKKNELETNGFTLKEYGVIFASKNSYIANDGIKITKNSEGEYVTASDKIVKVAVHNGEEFVGNYIKHDDTKTQFAGAIVKYDSNYTTDSYTCAYSVFVDSFGGEYISYAFSETTDYKFTNLYQITLDMYVNGAINASNTDSEMIWNYLGTGAAVFTEGTDYTLPEGGLTDLDGNAIGSTFTFLDVPFANQYKSGDTLMFSKSNCTISVLNNYKTGEYVAFYRGTGATPNLAYWSNPRRSSQLSGQFAAIVKDTHNAVSSSRPNPTLSSAVSAKIKTVIIDSGITKLNGESFTNHSSLETVVYPSTLKEIGGACFQSNGNLSTIYPAQENGVYVEHEVGLYDVSKVPTIGNGWTFNSNHSVKKVHLPASITSISNQFFQLCYELTKVWCGDAAEPAKGVADFTGSSLKSVSGDGIFKNNYYINTIILPMTVTTMSGNDMLTGCGSKTSAGGVTIKSAEKIDVVETFVNEKCPDTVTYEYNTAE